MQTKTVNLLILISAITFAFCNVQTVSAATPSQIDINYNITGTELAQGTHVGNLMVKPNDSSDYQFMLIGGAGSQHNKLFQIQDNSLLTDTVIKKAGKKTLRLRAMSSSDTVESVLNIQVKDHFYPEMVKSDFNNQNVLSSTIKVVDKSIIERVQLMLMVNHTNLDSMKAQLTHKTNNKTVALVKSLSSTNNCGNDSMLLTLKTKAPSTIDLACPAIYDTSYQPTMSFLTYNSETMAGEWQIDIEIPSQSVGDSGTFHRWAIGFTEKPSSSTQAKISISNQILSENDTVGTKVGTLQVDSAAMGSNITYSLVSGKGDNHNHLFAVKDEVLYVDSNLTAGKKAIRVQATDGNKTLEETGSISVEGHNNTDSTTYQSANELLKDKKLAKYDTSENDTTITTYSDSVRYVKLRDSAKSPSNKKGQSDFTAIDDQGSEFSVSSFYPNPFTDQTSLQYSLDSKSSVNLKIFNINGELIQQFKRDHQSPGSHQLRWNGQSDNERAIEKGTYIYSLEIVNAKGKTERKSGKLVLMD